MQFVLSEIQEVAGIVTRKTTMGRPKSQAAVLGSFAREHSVEEEGTHAARGDSGGEAVTQHFGQGAENVRDESDAEAQTK